MAIRIGIDGSKGRLDKFLAQLRPEVPRSQWVAWIRTGKVLINGIPAFKSGQALKTGDVLETELPTLEPPAAHLVPEHIDLPTLFEDDRLWIINKPMGMVVHPGPGHPNGTVLNALLARIGFNAPLAGRLNGLSGLDGRDAGDSEEGEMCRQWPGLVHRLDRYTSGCMAMAKDEGAKTCLQSQFKDRRVEKTYLAIARQSRKLPEFGSLLIDAPIARHRHDRTKMAIQPHGKSAQTRVKALGKSKGLALVSCDIITGRTHQIRIHLASIGAPLLGDPLYGGATAWQSLDSTRTECPHPALHAWKLALGHPDGKRLSITADMPNELENLLAAFGLDVFLPETD